MLFRSQHLENNNFRHRITEETIEAVFRWILDEAESAGALSLAEVNADREAYGKKLLDEGDGPPKTGGKKRDNTSKKKLARRKKAAKGQKR